MSIGQRWPSWHRIGPVLAVTLLLCAGCTIENINRLPRTAVPGIRDEVVAQKFTDARGDFYIVTDGRTIHYVYAGDPAFEIIDSYFRHHTATGAGGIDRSAIPGGAGPLPPPAVQ